ncbi:hypothetical protein [Actinoplanes couchii]|uniref:Uncharacterized protein n=1 Tax=Actinoplanes couchii TaxID=403638 RepID=A0ABQ3XHE2_9ACTN|nr:hypothetical protein [Actinoplanes couchii]MDR6317535.1 hypothetical protein [Actinoplanes couchii]GID57917.1 hypothetical protein Aco03nite_063210 [Actinoplanes couchii]
MTSDYTLDVPEDFDDSTDEDGQVHPVARRIFTADTAAEVFGKAQTWIAANQVFLVDVSWNWMHDEPEPFMLSVYFTFEPTP